MVYEFDRLGLKQNTFDRSVLVFRDREFKVVSRSTSLRSYISSVGFAAHSEILHKRSTESQKKSLNLQI
jgi:hypothetical protein